MFKHILRPADVTFLAPLDLAEKYNKNAGYMQMNSDEMLARFMLF